MNIDDKIKQYISNQLGIATDQITMQSELGRDLNLSKLEVDDLITSLEKEFKTIIPRENIEEFKTVGNVINSLKDNLDEFQDKIL